ncbi:hypothetical protein SAMN05216299_1138 [Nitrosospira sp. Nsp14]|uniref:hypothetical protein n=1 Tax=Nitrosospira sp. Nsp14 TaxID=1855333 RepID=UPI0008ECEFDC|nr:hypothetical protein [Nitrosospira sp. Nsp14]SFH43949.1 hypothetical protein SAMN05216299_1138 [Nitrosospira sp. Nsp14]
MRQFVIAARAAVAQGNWYAALAIALTMPDICGRIENPSKSSKARFVEWYDRFLLKRYQANIGASRTLHTFLGGLDCYALRCAFLHQGEFGIDDQRVRRALQYFHFTAPQQGFLVHMNQINNVLQLQIDQFCLDVSGAVEEWLVVVADDKDIQARLAKLASIG